jgi:L-threonylcarbamoyladenylate synthase
MADIGTDLNRAKKLLDNEQVVGIPTETVYGLAANALSEKAVLKVFEVKERPSFDPLIVHIYHIDQLSRYVHLPDKKWFGLIERYWPGPLTVLLPKKNIIPDITTSGLDMAAIRIPSHPVINELLSQLDYPLAAPSANRFGYISPTTANHVNQGIGEKIEYILDGGSSNLGLESTIISFRKDSLVIHRWGSITLENIEDVLPGVDIIVEINASSNPAAPGMLTRHYAPHTPFYTTDNINLFLEQYEGRKIVTISFSKEIVGDENNTNFVLSKKGDLHEAAANLFSVLREADHVSSEAIIAERVPELGLGRAINDRLSRASSK